eukprot:TRINITY_DN127981_c0_g1_i4.p1 TRINITY_DN127981_c0_g1~~TRINITY_DN127981_c0_g1_i4.p1  ORF type:complete len:193 (-),score=29.12 TRINITY_DN127981_c0_g1_i4:173-709(-)
MINSMGDKIKNVTPLNLMDLCKIKIADSIIMYQDVCFEGYILDNDYEEIMKYSSHVITPEAQWKLERLNKGFIVHLDEMWKRHVQKRFGISTIPADFKTWKQYFKHLVKEDKQQSKLVSKKLGLSLSSREKKSSQITEIPSETDRRNMRTVTKQKQRTVVKRARSPQTIGTWYFFYNL